MPAKDGDLVKVEYVGKLDDGTVFDESKSHGAPLEFVLGSGQLIKGFDDAVKGMEKDEEKEFHLEADEAYGEMLPDLKKPFPKEQFPEDDKIKEGETVIMAGPGGMQIPATIAEITDTEIVLDFNHPLAGKALNFWIKVVDFGPAPEGACPPGCHCESDCCTGNQ